ncbi:hypothetical protein PCI56_13395 [Plesiomonas shigelloides subsp. oncorhynchi]|nr:hypothetical protein [Plesiomonas shigelloides]
MAMTKCRECGKDVSTEAKVCPHCGVEKPRHRFCCPCTSKEKGSGVGVVGGLFILFFSWFLFSKCTSSESTEDKAQAEAECRQDLQCWGDKNSLAASMKCDQEIERLAKTVSNGLTKLLNQNLAITAGWIRMQEL